MSEGSLTNGFIVDSAVTRMRSYYLPKPLCDAWLLVSQEAGFKPRIDRITELAIAFGSKVSAVVDGLFLNRHSRIEWIFLHREAVKAIQV